MLTHATSHRPRWTPTEDRQLAFFWGECHGIDYIAERLGRTPAGVRYRAVLVLRLGPMGRGRMSCLEAARYTGWDREALQRAARALGIKWKRQPVSKPEYVGHHRRRARWLLDIEDVDRLVAWLEEHGGQREGCAAPVPGGRKRAVAEKAWNSRTCRSCGRTWTVPVGLRRGRPSVRCLECRGLAQQPAEARP